jgi:hypothetical protein
MTVDPWCRVNGDSKLGKIVRHRHIFPHRSWLSRLTLGIGIGAVFAKPDLSYRKSRVNVAKRKNLFDHV